MIFLRIVFPFLVFSGWGVFVSIKNDIPQIANPPAGDSIKNFSQIFYPKAKRKDKIVKHAAYALCYDERYEQARWVAYRLTAAMCMNKTTERTDDFREDTAVKTGSAIPDDYKKSGYDKGHLCPAGDMSWNPIVMSETFLMSNMSPQVPKFNRGIWKVLEEQVRDWAKKEEELYIVTAGVLKEKLPTIGKTNKVAVPNYYYKIVLDISGVEQKAIAFIMPNEGSKKSIYDFAVTIDSVERLTGINFFSSLPDKIENKLESTTNIESWK